MTKPELKRQTALERLMIKMPSFAKRLSTATVMSALVSSNTDQISLIHLFGNNSAKSYISSDGFNPVGTMQKDLRRAFFSSPSTIVAQNVTTSSNYTLKNPSLKIPHTIINGEITKDSAYAFITDLKQSVQRLGKQKYYYVFINSPGGNVDAGFDMLTETNKLISQGYKIRVVIQKAQSMAAIYAFGIKGPRMITDNAAVTTHASYYRTQDGFGCKIGEACLTPEQEKNLQDSVQEFSKLTAGRSCALQSSVAELLFQKWDRNISVNEMLDYGLADYRVNITKNGWVQVIQKGECKPIDNINALLKIADPDSFVDHTTTSGIVPPKPVRAIRPIIKNVPLRPAFK